MNIVGRGAHRRRKNKQQQRERQRFFAPDAVAQWTKKQLTETKANQRCGQRELGLRAAGVQLLGYIRQRGQIEIGAQRADGG
ncbi:Uncharacterised protein [Raoultella ornithinolytica]|nr:Uncharacterised protein [Raoultella ornithinolytica]